MKRCNAGCFTPIMGDWDTCGDCKNKIAVAALADGYTVADGQAWRPCCQFKEVRESTSADTGYYCKSCCQLCDKDGLVRAGGGGT